MKERSDVMSRIRREIVGPADSEDGTEVNFVDDVFTDSEMSRSGQLVWYPEPDMHAQEIIYFNNETPHRKYGSGRLHPHEQEQAADELALQVSDFNGMDDESEDEADDSEEERAEDRVGGLTEETDNEDFQISDGDTRFPSSMGITFCAGIPDSAKLQIDIPQEYRFRRQRNRFTDYLGRY